MTIYLNRKYNLIISQRVFKIRIYAKWYFRNSPKIIIIVLSCYHFDPVGYTPRQTFPVYMITRIWCWCAEWFYRFRFDDSWDVHSYIYLGRFSFHSHALAIDVSANRHWILDHVILLYRQPLQTSRTWRTPHPLTITNTCAYYQESSSEKLTLILCSVTSSDKFVHIRSLFQQYWVVSDCTSEKICYLPFASGARPSLRKISKAWVCYLITLWIMMLVDRWIKYLKFTTNQYTGCLNYRKTQYYLG